MRVAQPTGIVARRGIVMERAVVLQRDPLGHGPPCLAKRTSSIISSPPVERPCSDSTSATTSSEKTVLQISGLPFKGVTDIYLFPCSSLSGCPV